MDGEIAAGVHASGGPGSGEKEQLSRDSLLIKERVPVIFIDNHWILVEEVYIIPILLDTYVCLG